MVRVHKMVLSPRIGLAEVLKCLTTVLNCCDYGSGADASVDILALYELDMMFFQYIVLH